jgi:hypothetical protein
LVSLGGGVQPDRSAVARSAATAARPAASRMAAPAP